MSEIILGVTRRLALGILGFDRFVVIACVCLFVGNVRAERPFDFHRDTFSFANDTVFEYHDGHASLRRDRGPNKPKRFTQHCFVMSRAVVQFRKFARFDKNAPPLDDKKLAGRIRKIMRRATWDPPLPERDRIVIPGYADLRSLSLARTNVVQRSVGLGWTSNFRPGNWRAMFPNSTAQQARTHKALEHAMERHEFFVAYLTTLPRSLSINHGVLIYARQPHRNGRNPGGKMRYSVYDPNHAGKPRTLEWSPRDRSFSYERDWDFVGGRVIVWQVYGRPLQ